MFFNDQRELDPNSVVRDTEDLAYRPYKIDPRILQAAKFAGYFTPAAPFIGGWDAYQNAKQGNYGQAALDLGLGLVGGGGTLKLLKAGTKAYKTNKALKAVETARDARRAVQTTAPAAAGNEAGRLLDMSRYTLDDFAKQIPSVEARMAARQEARQLLGRFGQGKDFKQKASDLTRLDMYDEILLRQLRDGLRWLGGGQ